MSLLKAIFLGIVQGVTEFLPVSSSGHLALFEKLFGLKEAGLSFNVFLHLGTLIAVVAVYWRDISKLVIEGIGLLSDAVRNLSMWVPYMVATYAKKQEVQKPKYYRIIKSAYRKFAMLVIVSTIPTGIIGLLGKELVGYASDTLIVPGICLIITAILLFMSDQLPDGDKTPKKTNFLHAIFIGTCQGIATLPGLSRSGVTITAGEMCGLKREFAVKYSFIMSIPAILGAMLIDAPEMKRDIAFTSPAYYVIGAIVSAVVGYICIKTMIIIVRKKNFKYFAYYCATIGMIAVIASFIIK